MITRDAVVLDGAMLDEARGYLRLEIEEEDAALGTVLLGAIGHAEGYLGQMLLLRGVSETLPASTEWQRLGGSPVTMISAVVGVPADGASFTLATDVYKLDVNSKGDGWLRVTRPGTAGQVRVAYQAGLATGWADLPEAIRLGTLRLAGHLYANRDDPTDTGPPGGVATLLRPWRRMRL